LLRFSTENIPIRDGTIQLAITISSLLHQPAIIEPLECSVPDFISVSPSVSEVDPFRTDAALRRPYGHAMHPPPFKPFSKADEKVIGGGSAGHNQQHSTKQKRLVDAGHGAFIAYFLRFGQ